jgi:hypothetical protein
MVQEVETNRLIPVYTPLYFGWTISLYTSSRNYISVYIYEEEGEQSRKLKSRYGARNRFQESSLGSE